MLFSYDRSDNKSTSGGRDDAEATAAPKAGADALTAAVINDERLRAVLVAQRGDYVPAGDIAGAILAVFSCGRAAGRPSGAAGRCRQPAVASPGGSSTDNATIALRSFRNCSSTGARLSDSRPSLGSKCLTEPYACRALSRVRTIPAESVGSSGRLRDRSAESRVASSKWISESGLSGRIIQHHPQGLIAVMRICT